MIDTDYERADRSAMSSEWSDTEPPMGGPRFIATTVDVPSHIIKIPVSAYVYASASIGEPGEDARRSVGSAPNHGVTIGDRTTVREFVTVHGGFEAPTVVGADCYLMTKSHVGHDCVLHDRVTVCSGAILGGHTIVHEGATVGLGAITHPKVTIGAYAYVGAGAVVIRDVPPFATVVGSPARIIGVNTEGMRRAGFDAADIAFVSDCWAEFNGYAARPDSARMQAAMAAFDRDKGRHKQ